MARSLSGVTALATSVSSGAKLIINRKGYAGAAAAAGKFGDDRSLRKVKVGGDSAAAAPPASAWIPDPVTGYYRPANRRAEVDAAELRETLLAQK